MIIVRVKMFADYSKPLPGACRDLLACHGIWRKCCPASAILLLEWMPWGQAGLGEVLLRKQEFAETLQAGSGLDLGFGSS